MKQITGGVTAVKGFQAASTAAGIKYKDRKDMAMIYSEVPCKAAGTFTTNIVKAAPVKWDHNVVYNSCLLYTFSEPTRRTPISYAVFCLKKKKYEDYSLVIILQQKPPAQEE